MFRWWKEERELVGKAEERREGESVALYEGVWDGERRKNGEGAGTAHCLGLLWRAGWKAGKGAWEERWTLRLRAATHGHSSRAGELGLAYTDGVERG